MAGAVLGLVVVVCLAAAAYGVIRTAEIRNDLVDRLYPAETENLRLTAALVDEETGIRGYAATGDRSFLAPTRPAAPRRTGRCRGCWHSRARRPRTSRSRATWGSSGPVPGPGARSTPSP